MGAPDYIRASDVAAVHRLVSECRELGADAHTWQHHLIDQLRDRLGCYMGGVVETNPTPRGMTSDFSTHLQSGWSDDERQVAVELLTSGDFPRDLFCLRLSRMFVENRPLELTRQRQELIGDSEWFRSETYETYRLTGASDIVMSLLHFPDRQGRAFCLGLTRSVGERPMNGREVRFVGLFSRLLQPHLGRALTLMGEPGIAELSARRKQVLAALIDGLSEKETAHALQLSVATVHEYVMDLYRHFRVRSRSELLALFLRRQLGPASQWVERFRIDKT